MSLLQMTKRPQAKLKLGLKLSIPEDQEVFVVEKEACGLPRQDRYEGAEASEMLHKFVKRMVRHRLRCTSPVIAL